MDEHEVEFEWKCCDCGEICSVIEETFDYAGTHCTFGRSGTHRTGHYVSACCFSEFEEADYSEDESIVIDEHSRFVPRKRKLS